MPLRTFALSVAALTVCALLLDERTAGQQSGVTVAGDVAPIVFASCATCHRPGGSAPFSLLTDADVKSRANRIGRRHGRPEHAALEARTGTR
jgi:hypothetical protein